MEEDWYASRFALSWLLQYTHKILMKVNLVSFLQHSFLILFYPTYKLFWHWSLTVTKSLLPKYTTYSYIFFQNLNKFGIQKVFWSQRYYVVICWRLIYHLQTYFSRYTSMWNNRYLTTTFFWKCKQKLFCTWIYFKSFCWKHQFRAGLAIRKNASHTVNRLILAVFQTLLPFCFFTEASEP